QRGKRKTERELRFERLADDGAVAAQGAAGETLVEPRLFAGSNVVRTGGPREYNGTRGFESHLFRHTFQTRFQLAFVARAAVAADGVDGCVDAGATGFGMLAGFEDEEGGGRAGDDAAAGIPVTRPERRPAARRMRADGL